MSNELKFETSSEAQKKALNELLYWKVISEIWFWWWAGGWKSYTGVAWQWMMRMAYPWTKWFFWRNQLINLKKTTLATYYKFCQDYKIPEIQRWRLNWKTNTIIFDMEKILWPKYKWVKSEILLLDLAYKPSDPLNTRFWSLELTDWFIDESNEVNSSIIEILHTRIWRALNDKYNLKPKILETFNPDKWHIYRRYWKPYKENKMPKTRIFIPSLAKDNKKVDKAYLEQLYNMPDWPNKERLLYWNFDYDDTPWRLFPDDKIQDLWSNYAEPSDFKCIIWDVAREGKDFATIWVFEWFKLIAYEIIPKWKLDRYWERVEAYRRKYWIPKSQVAIDEDWVGGWVVDFMWYKWIVNNSSPLPEWFDDEWRPVIPNYQNLKTQLYFKASQNFSKINLEKLSPEHRDMLAEELANIVEVDFDKDWKIKIISKEKLKEKIWRSPDLADTLAYRFFFEVWEQETFFDITIW